MSNILRFHQNHIPKIIEKKKGLSEEEFDFSKMSKQAIYSDEVFQLLQKCLDLFLNNKFEESEKLVKEHSTWSVYSSVGYSLIWFIRSMMTFDKTDGNVALENLNQTVNLCSKFKKDQSAITSWWQGSKQYDNYTKDELHAELIAGLIETGLMTSCESNFFTKKCQS